MPDRPIVTTGAILVTDMVGSTELRSRLEGGRADQLRHDHDRLVGRVVDACNGVVLRWTGDGVKAGFSSASDAVDAAVEIQRAVVEYRTSAGAVAAFELRIGMSAGEVLIEGGDHHGLAAIEAARLEAMARPGEILATDLVRVLAQRRANVAFEAIGPRMLKGLDDPVTVLRVVDLTAMPVPPLPPHLVVDGLTLVGRDDELARFRTSWAATRRGIGGCLMANGSTGVGKSRLLATFAAAAYDSGAIVLAGTCSPERSIPYEPFVAALADAAPLDPALDAALRNPAAPLARLFPGSTAGNAAAQPVSARVDLFDAVAGVLRRLSKLHPLLLVLDDLHDASSSTILLLRHLVDAVAGDRVLIACSARDDAIATTHPLHDLMADVAGLDNGMLLELGMLSENDLAALVREASPQLAQRHVGERAYLLHQETAGSPLFAVALLDHLDHLDHLERDREPRGGRSAALPESVQELVLARVDRLPVEARELLRIGAAVGQTFDVDVVAGVAQRPIADVRESVALLQRARFVTALDSAQSTFTQGIVRSALLDSFAPGDRADLHGRVAAVIEARTPDNFDELAHHWRLAGDDANAMRHLARAARRDMVALAYESARAKSQEVVDVLGRSPNVDVLTRAEAWLGLGAAQRSVGQPSYTQAITRAARLATSIGHGDLLAEAAALSTWPGTFFFIAEEIDNEMVQLCRDALDALPNGGALRVRVLATLASHLTFNDDRDHRLALIEEARELALGIGDPLLVAHVHCAEFLCTWEAATLERREQIGVELGRIAAATGDVEYDFLSGFFAAYCTAERGELPVARQLLVELLPRAELTQTDYFTFLVERLILSIDIACGGSDVAARVDGLVVRYGTTHADTDGTWALQTGTLAHQSGTLGHMINALQAMTTGRQAHTWLAALALAHLCAGDTDRARAVLDEQGETPHNYFWISVALVQAEVSATVGDDARRRRLFEQLLPYRGRVGITASGSACYGLVSRTLGELAISLGDHDLAVELLQESVEHADRITLILDRVASRRLLATAYRARSTNAAEVETLLAEAITFATQHHLAREVTLLESLRSSPT